LATEAKGKIQMITYPDTKLYIGGRWRDGTEKKCLLVDNPATGEIIGRVAHASRDDLDHALIAAERGFQQWRKIGVLARSELMRRAAGLLRGRSEAIATLMTIEQGKPLPESRLEASAAADTIEWFAEECRRAYGRIVPSRAANVTQLVLKEPVGPVAAFTPWNFPLNQAVRKVSAALAAGCSVILKGPEETPASCAALVGAFADAGLPDGVLNLVFGVPSEISTYLIPHPTIRKVSFTGSTAVGKQLAALAGLHMKRGTMELGGHAPAIVFGDADLDLAVKNLSSSKYRNAGQVCIAPTRILVQDSVYRPFVEGFVAATEKIVVGNGLEDGVTMGPLANSRRVDAMQAFTLDAIASGATVLTGGQRIGNRGHFFQPTVLTDVPLGARVLNEEPFGPIEVISRFKDYGDAVSEANRLPYGLAAYAYTTSARTMANIGVDIESGMVSINHHGLALPELPFGGVKDSGHGSEGGIEAMEAYLNTRLVTQAA
jgi:succinate-semialdehyde dehydrogenase / glutarate-semialdehyde dehydrogenase